MRRILYFGARSITLETAPGPRTIEPWLAGRLVRLAARAPSNMTALRRLLAEVSQDPSLHGLEDDAVLAALEACVARGALRVVEVSPGPDLTAFGGAAEDEMEPASRGEPIKKRTWVEIRLVDMESNPLPGVRYELKLPDGVVLDGQLDGEGRARVDDIDPGSCEISFPDLDAEAWEPSGARG